MVNKYEEYVRNMRVGSHLRWKIWDPIPQDRWQSEYDPKNFKLLNRMNAIFKSLKDFVPDYNVEDTVYNDDVEVEKLALMEILEQRAIDLRKECDSTFKKRFRRIHGYSYGQ